MINETRAVFKAIIIFVAVFAIVGIYGLATRPAKEVKNAGDEKIKIVATFYPHAFVARAVGGDLVEVLNLTPAGSEPHDYEPTPKDMAAIYRSSLFVYNGNGLDAWAGDLDPFIFDKGRTVINASKFITALPVQSGIPDPHFWLDPSNIGLEADIIAGALSAMFPVHAETFMKNRNDLRARLRLLDDEYRSGLGDCVLRDIITSHNAFNYLGKAYNFNSIYISGLAPDEEPSAQRIGQIADLARQKGIGHIFFETLADPKLSETVAKEIGARTLVLNPIEGLTDEEATAGKNYISIMTDNLVNLRTALLCR